MRVFREFVRTSIPGCYVIRPWRHLDERGLFVKTFHAEAFREAGLETDFREGFYSVSRKGVLRGIHFQRPPYQHAILVYCAKGHILDAIVDLRTDSQGFGAQETFELSATGLITDQRRGRGLHEGSAWHAAFLLEAVCRAKHGIVAGFLERADGRIQPVHVEEGGTRDAERESERTQVRIQSGVLAYAEWFVETYPITATDEVAIRLV